MDRYFVRTAAIVVCAAWAAGCGGTDTSEKLSAPPPDPATQAADAEAPVTLDGEIAQAHVQRVKGDIDGAARSFGQLMLVAPDDPRVVSEYAKTLVEQGQAAEALPFLERALELQGNDWSIYSALGVAYDQVGDRTRARLAYERALVLKPGAPQVLNNFAMSRMLAGDLAGARRLLVQASTSGDPKIAANLARLGVTTKDTAPSVRLPVAHPTAISAPPAISADAFMRPPSAIRMTVLPPPMLAAGDGYATASPRSVLRDVPPRMIEAHPRVVAGVEMQRVPFDPLAGPYGAHAPVKRVFAQWAPRPLKLATRVVHKVQPQVPLRAALVPANLRTAQQPVTAPRPVQQSAPVQSAASAKLPVLRTAADDE